MFLLEALYICLQPPSTFTLMSLQNFFLNFLCPPSLICYFLSFLIPTVFKLASLSLWAELTMCQNTILFTNQACVIFKWLILTMTKQHVFIETCRLSLSFHCFVNFCFCFFNGKKVSLYSSLYNVHDHK